MAKKKNTDIRQISPERFSPHDLLLLAMARALAPKIMPALAAVAILPSHLRVHVAGRVHPANWDDQGNVIVGERLAQDFSPCHLSNRSRPMPTGLLIMADFAVAAVEGRSALKSMNEAWEVWHCALGLTGSLEDQANARWAPPSAMTAQDAEAALSAAVALPYLLAHPVPVVREWAFENMHLLG